MDSGRDHTLALLRAAVALLAAALFISITAIGERQYKRAHPEQVAVIHAGVTP